MANLTGILIGAGVAGVGLLILRARSASSSSTSKDKCAIARDLAEKAQPGTGAAAYAACKALGLVDNLLDAVIASNNTAENVENETNRRDALNKQLNGDVQIAMPGTPGGANVETFSLRAGYAYDENGQYIERYGSTAYGSAMEFVNGCQPFADAPGWSKCAPGTQSMWYRDINDSLGYVQKQSTSGPSMTKPAFVSVEAAKAQLEKDRAAGLADKWSTWPTRPVDRKSFGTGSARLEGGADVMTRGPFRAPDGKQFWIYKGKRIDCPVGQTPNTIRDAALGVVDHRTDIAPACVPIDSESPWGGNVEAPPVAAPIGSSGTTRTELACDGTNAPAGYTWVPATSTVPGHWERLRAGQVPNPGPCAPSSPINLRNSVLATGAGTLAALNGGL